ncbi:serine hydrolase domain-containing protein [Novosphingobium cyanobacteriorum]|uniref:Serine hydrolase n=1 Tax=Novosphingobium cyanobacteriorum TaxID=3024215 RepID=A0ABT6CF76_9SPHN|nr:serine hydrolase domain-containing protein [Novosphingobium cyanobacteriorum]MDF8332572.1 serine hydrolase [Novosphingobium cyanobacteriorum]
MIETALTRRALLRTSALLGAGALLPGASRAGPQWANVKRLVTGYVDGGKLPGMVAILGQGQAAPHVIARGTTERGASPPVTADSLFRIYSMTKPITGMAAMILADEGKLGLDQPLGDILPRFARMQVLDNPDAPLDQVRPVRNPITIRHLLTHTAGLGYTIVQKGPIKQAYEDAGLVPARVSRVPMPDLDTLHPAPSLAAFADRLAKLPLVYEPGERWSYSVSLDLLGRVIEVVSGLPLDAFMAERIFGPCGMQSTAFQVPRRDAARLTTNYGYFDGMPVPLDPARASIYFDPPAFPFGGAGLVSSPRDYDRFLAMLLGGGRLGRTRVMSDAAVRLGMANLLPPAAIAPQINGRVVGFGAGGMVGLGEDAGTFGWSGAAGTVGFINAPRSVRAGLFVQFMPFNAFAVQSEFPAAVKADILA